MNTSDELKNNLFDQSIKNALDNYEVQPSEKVWMALEKEISQGKFKQTRLSGKALLIWALGLLSLSGTIAYLYNSKSAPHAVIEKHQPPASITKISAPLQTDQNVAVNEKMQSTILIKKSSSTNRDFINAMPLKNAPALQVGIPSVDIEPKAVEQAMVPVHPLDGRIEKKLEKRMDANDAHHLDYKDEQHDINNNTLYNTEIRENTDARENSHLNHK